MKQCNKCNQLLDESEFELRNDTEKLRGQCKECTKKQKRKYDKVNKDRLREKRKKWEKENKEKLQDYQKKYRNEHRKKFRGYSKKWRNTNKEKEQERYQKNKEESRILKCQICRKEFTENDMLCQDDDLLMYHIKCYEDSINEHQCIMIKCSRCRRILPKSKFDTYQKRNELRSWCEDCWKKINEKYDTEKWNKISKEYIKYDYTVLFHNSPTLCDDFDWLYDQRVNKRKSIQKIAESANCTYKVALTALRKSGLNKYSADRKTREIEPKNHVVLSQEAIDFINGLMLGDGSIKHMSTLSARFKQDSKHKEYIEFIQKEFKLFGIEGHILKSKRYDLRYDKTRTYYSFISLSYDCFFHLYNKWYLNDSYFCPYCNVKHSIEKVNLCEKSRQPKCFECGHNLQRKIVPEDIRITKNTLLHWYLGDGFLCNSKGYYSIGLCTDGFLDKDIKLLQRKLNQTLKINSTYGNTKRRRIFIYKKSDVKRFFEYIEECSINCFEFNKFPDNLKQMEYK